MSPALNGSVALQRFEHSNAVEIRNGIMFDFYPGLPHMLLLFSAKNPPLSEIETMPPLFWLSKVV